MGTVQKIAAELEWLSWSQTMNMLKAGGVNYPWKGIGQWCERGRVQAKVATVVGIDDMPSDVTLPAGFWEICNKHEIAPDPLNGSITTKVDGELATLVGLSFLKEDVLKLVPHLSESEVQAALSAPDWLSGKRKVEVAPVIEAVAAPASGKRGRKPEMDRWQSFYFAAIELAQQRRLNPASFSSAAELKEELLLMMGDGAFNPDHAEPFVQQIYKKFFEGA